MGEATEMLLLVTPGPAPYSCLVIPGSAPGRRAGGSCKPPPPVSVPRQASLHPNPGTSCSPRSSCATIYIAQRIPHPKGSSAGISRGVGVYYTAGRDVV